MAGELAGFDVLPPELVDRVIAWCFLKHGRASGRDAALEALRQKHGISPAAAAPLVDAAITRSQGWTRAQAQALAWELDGWERPVPLSAVPALPAFPVDIYPPWIAAEVRALAGFTQTPEDLAGTVVLSVLACALGGRARIEVRPGWDEPANLYTAVALPPGSRKSTVHATLTAPMLGAEESLSAEAGARIGEARTARSVADKAAARAAVKAAAFEIDPAKDKASQLRKRDELQADAVAAAALAEAITVPVVPHFVADDVGPEKAAAMMAEQGGRLAILSAEGGPFVTLAGRYSREPNLELFLKGWSGDPMRVDRLGRPPDHIEHPALTLGLTVQPEVLKQIFGMPGFRGRGLLARVLYSMPASMVGHRKVRTEPVHPDISSAYVLTMGALVRSFAEWTDPVRFQLTPGAAEMVLQAMEALEPRLDPYGGDLGHLADWGGKLIGTTVRIAALLHAAWHLQDGYRWPVSEDTLARALAAGEYFTAHALAVFDFMGADPAAEDARAVLAWIRRTGQARFTRRDLHRALSARFKKAGDMDPALEMLAGHGWIRPAVTAEPGSQGGRRPSPAFDAHPSLLTVP